MRQGPESMGVKTMQAAVREVMPFPAEVMQVVRDARIVSEQHHRPALRSATEVRLLRLMGGGEVKRWEPTNLGLWEPFRSINAHVAQFGRYHESTRSGAISESWRRGGHPRRIASTTSVEGTLMVRQPDLGPRGFRMTHQDQSHGPRLRGV